MSTFVASAVLAATAFAAAAVLSPNTADPGQARLDVVGSVLSAPDRRARVRDHRGQPRGWADPLSVAGLAVAVAGLAGWALWSLRIEHPLLDPRLFRLRVTRPGRSPAT